MRSVRSAADSSSVQRLSAWRSAGYSSPRRNARSAADSLDAADFELLGVLESLVAGLQELGDAEASTSLPAVEERLRVLEAMAAH